MIISSFIKKRFEIWKRNFEKTKRDQIKIKINCITGQSTYEKLIRNY